MIKVSLETFVTSTLDAGEITSADVQRLQREVLPDGIASRDEADMLIALDRAVARKSPAWSAFAIGAVTEFVVWTSRPTGLVDRDAALWLTTSLGCGTGPTPMALAIAFEVVRECERADEVLVAFVMRHAARKGQRVVGVEALAA